MYGCVQLTNVVYIPWEVMCDHIFTLAIEEAMSVFFCLQSEDTLFHKVYFVSSVRDITSIDWKKEYCNRSDLPDLPVSQHLPQYVQ